jgi:hypothetical protein
VRYGEERTAVDGIASLAGRQLSDYYRCKSDSIKLISIGLTKRIKIESLTGMGYTGFEKKVYNRRYSLR